MTAEVVMLVVHGATDNQGLSGSSSYGLHFTGGIILVVHQNEATNNTRLHLLTRWIDQ